MFMFLGKNFPRSRAFVRASQAPELLKRLSTSSKKTLKSSKCDENKHLFTINYLENVLGFPPERALSASNYINFRTPEKPNSVISFFKNHGFTATQIFKLARTFPLVLVCDPEKTLLPKIEFFQSLGFSITDVKAMLSAQPNIFGRSLEKQILPSFDLMKDILKSHEKALTSLRSLCGILTSDFVNTVIPNVECLKEVGVPESNIVYLLRYQPRSFMVRHPKFRKTVEQVKDMGFYPLGSKFVLAIHAFTAMNKSTWEKKVDIYKKWGCSEDEIFEAFGKNPRIMMASEDKIMAIMELLVDKLGFEPSYFLKRPGIITYSLEDRIIPRSIIYQALSKKGLIPKNFSLASFFSITEEKFLRRFVERFEAESPELLALYKKVLPLSP